jgi:hypothetical protein
MFARRYETLGRITSELKQHAPFTMMGAITGLVIMAMLIAGRAPRSVSHGLFWTLHPVHVLLSAAATTGMYRHSGGGRPIPTIVIGFTGAVGIATLSDSIIPFLGEWLLDLPHRAVHLGFIEKWWLVHPLAAAGIAAGYRIPATRLPHAGHVLLSTWASLFHMNLAIGDTLRIGKALPVLIFLFLAVWVPCCTSDIAFPVLFARLRTGLARRDPAEGNLQLHDREPGRVRGASHGSPD